MWQKKKKIKFPFQTLAIIFQTKGNFLWQNFPYLFFYFSHFGEISHPKITLLMPLFFFKLLFAFRLFWHFCVFWIILKFLSFSFLSFSFSCLFEIWTFRIPWLRILFFLVFVHVMFIYVNFCSSFRRPFGKKKKCPGIFLRKIQKEYFSIKIKLMY